MAYTLLHTADIHLGKSFSNLPPERAEQRRADLLATLTRLCKRAGETRADLLVIAGDLFDRPRPAGPLLASVRRALADAGVPVLLVPGNHDPLGEGSPYLENRWPGNVIIAAKPGWQRVPLDGPELWAFGYALGGAHNNPWRDFPGCGGDALLVLHASCLSSGMASEAGYYPFTPADIPACAYLALGHHHRSVSMNSTPAAWYAGSPEPLEAEVTPAVALSVTLDGGTANVEPLDVATRRHRLVSLEVTGLTGEDIWERAQALAETDHLLTLRLTGMLEAAESLDLAALQADLSARCFAAEVEAKEMYLPVEASEAGGVMGVLREMARARLAALATDDPERRRLEQAVRYAALALEGKL